MTLVVRRSSLRMWLFALGGIPLLVMAIDVLTNRRVTNWLRGILFRPDDTQLFEPRDVIYAWVMFSFGAFLVLWGLKELFYPTKILEARANGLSIRLRGPFRGPDLIPWERIKDIRPGEIEDEGQTLPLLMLELMSRADLPPHPWGARWIEPDLLGLLAQDWADSPEAVTEKITGYAVNLAKEERRQRTGSIWDPE